MGIQWSSDFLVGNATIDRQHQELFKAFSTLIDACRQGHGKEKIEELLDFLEVYVVFHFNAEDELMSQYNYPGQESHRFAHAGFVQQVKELKAKFTADGANMELLVTTNEVVLRWLIEHIRKTDAALGTFLRSQGAGA
jgi:hemerythrin